MSITNRDDAYGSVARAIHWFMAIAIVAMFGVGLWMRTLSYYSPYYQTAPGLHKAIGLALLGLLLFRFVWRQINIKPSDDYLPVFERIVSHLVHWAFYALLLALMISGYLISTADGRPISFFGLFDVPSLFQKDGMEDVAGFIHEYLAYAVIGLAVLHALAALKHHFFDRDVTLLRMWRGQGPN